MIKIIRANQKTVLTGLTIFAMITFVVNFGGKGSEGGVTDHKSGTIGGKAVYLSEISQARAELDAVKRYVNFAPNPQSESPDSYLDAQAVGLIEKEKPELFMLLRHEADQLGLTASEDDVEAYMRYRTRNLDTSNEAYPFAREGVKDMLRILARYHALRQTQKVCQPQVDQLLAETGESLQLKLVQLRADDFLDKVPAPTPEQAKAQFDQFSNTFAHHPLPTTNPFGFGYKLPQRATLQYVRLTDQAITDAVTKSKSDYDWDVEAHKYYYNNLSKYLQEPETPEGSALPGAAAPASRPVAKPFDKVEADILTELRKDPVATLKDQVQSYITTTMTADWQAYAKFVATDPKGTEPASSLGAPYSSMDYLLHLSASVHAKFNVNIAADKTPDFFSEDQYSSWPGLGSPAVTDFIDKQASDYVALLARNDPGATATLTQPSPALQGAVESIQLFVRLTAALPAQPPADLSLVRAQVETDVRLAAAYKIAQAEAASLLLAAKSNILDTTAKAAGHPVLTGDPPPSITCFSANLKNLAPPLGDDTPAFLKEGFKLLGVYEPGQNPHPAETIELPDQKRVFVAQLDQVQAIWDDNSYFEACATIRGRASFTEEEKFSQTWFNLENTTNRLDFKPVKGN